MIYVASRKKNAAILRALRDSGVPIISTWIDSVDSGRIPKPTQKEIWCNAFVEIGRCSGFVFHDGGDGALVELGIALGMGVEVVVATSAQNAPGHLIVKADDLDEALNLAACSPHVLHKMGIPPFVNTTDRTGEKS